MLGTAALDVLVGCVGVVYAGVLTFDPSHGWIPGIVRGLVVLALAGGAPVVGGLVALAAAAAEGARSPAGPWLALAVGLLHVGVPPLGLGVMALAFARIREGEA